MIWKVTNTSALEKRRLKFLGEHFDKQKNKTVRVYTEKSAWDARCRANVHIERRHTVYKGLSLRGTTEHHERKNEDTKSKEITPCAHVPLSQYLAI